MMYIEAFEGNEPILVNMDEVKFIRKKPNSSAGEFLIIVGFLPTPSRFKPGEFELTNMAFTVSNEVGHKLLLHLKHNELVIGDITNVREHSGRMPIPSNIHPLQS